MSDEKYFRFLNDLRESGQVNMFGASAYLAELFDLDKQEAREVWVRWTETFKTDHPGEPS